MTAWSPEQTERVQALWTAGYSGGQIAKKLGCGFSRMAVIGKVWRMGLKRVISKPLLAIPYPAERRSYRRGGAKAIRPLPPARAPKETATLADNIAASPRWWVTRERGECAWPVAGAGADTQSCCNPTSFTYCPQHTFIMTQRAA